ncbi:hypothetical protein ACFYSB_03885 [Streptomyces prasinus]|uniref:hypothetical protein n=1 Tax=Streptomyces prasinus TaxID=67345 RepID=UPI0036A66DCF
MHLQECEAEIPERAFTRDESQAFFDLYAQPLTRIAQRILAMATAFRHNHRTRRPVTRSLIAYDH